MMPTPAKAWNAVKLGAPVGRSAQVMLRISAPQVLPGLAAVPTLSSGPFAAAALRVGAVVTLGVVRLISGAAREGAYAYNSFYICGAAVI